MRAISYILCLLMLWSCHIQHNGRRQPTKESEETLAIASNPVANRLRGYDVINKLIRQRLLKDKNTFELVSYLEEQSKPIDAFDTSKGSAFTKLLGAYDGNGLRFDYQGRNPNTINMLLWYTIFSSFARDLARRCEGERELILDDDVDALLQDACKTHPTTEEGRRTWFALWKAILSDDVPNEEFEALSKLMAASTMQKEVPALKMQKSLHAMFMNPYFLIAH